jgi:hypothetical protein
LNGGQWELTLNIVWEENDYILSDIIEIREVDDDNYTITPTYSGIIEEIKVTEYEYTTLLEIKLLWAFTALNNILYKSGGRVFTKNDTPWNIIKDIISNFNSQYGWIFSDTNNLQLSIIKEGTIDISGSSVQIQFDNDSCLSAINKVLTNTSLAYFIWSTGEVDVFQTTGWVNRMLTIGREIVSIDRTVHKREMVNTYYLERNWAVEQTYTSPLLSTYWLFEKKEVNTDLLDANSQNNKWNWYIAEFASPRNEIIITLKEVSSNFIYPGEFITVQNTSMSIVGQQVTRISKWKNWTLNIWDFPTLWKAIKKSI